MIQFTTSEDTDAVLALAEATGLFEADQIEALSQMLDQHFNSAIASPDIWLTDYDSKPVGIAYVAPERMTHGTWNLYLIAINPNYQRQGRGATLLRYVEQMLTRRGERMLLVETSGTDDFEYVRKFYRDRGYEEEARIRDFYIDGVDKVVFRKLLVGATS